MKKIISLMLIVTLISSCKSSASNSSTVSSTINSSSGDINFPEFEVIFFNVGQGDSSLITLPSGELILIDSGNGTTSGSSAGTMILAYLQEKGINYIDFGILTHNDSDHIGGFPVIVNGGIDFGKIYFGPRGAETAIYNLVDGKINEVCAEKADCRNQLTTVATSEIVLSSNEYFSFNLLGPMLISSSDRNNMSLITKLVYRNQSVLFTGDCESSCETRLIDNFPAFLDADILKVGHHGSTSSTSANFLNLVTPNSAIIQSGIPNSYGHPAQATLTRLNNSHINIYRNDNNGMIKITSDGDSINIAVELSCQNNLLPSFTSASGEGSAQSNYYTYNRNHC